MWRLAFRVFNAGFRDHSLGCRVEGLRVSGFRVYVVRSRLQSKLKSPKPETLSPQP